MAKTLYILAGPNGSGKSTFYKSLFSHLHFIDPDLIQRSLLEGTPQPEIASARIALESLDQHLNGSSDFVVETTLTGNVEQRLFNRPKQLGWQIRLYFVCLESSDDNVRRIGERYHMGGHFIPADVVVRRYERSLETLSRVWPKADVVWF